MGLIEIFKKDIPSNVTKFLEFIWGSTVSAYISKGIVKIFKKGGG